MLLTGAMVGFEPTTSELAAQRNLLDEYFYSVYALYPAELHRPYEAA